MSPKPHHPAASTGPTSSRQRSRVIFNGTRRALVLVPRQLCPACGGPAVSMMTPSQSDAGENMFVRCAGAKAAVSMKLPGSQLNSKKQNHESLELMFVNLAGEQAQLDGIDPKISVTQLKRRLEGAEPWIPPAPSQKLIWGDVILSKGEASLSELGIPNKSTIHVHRQVVEVPADNGGRAESPDISAYIEARRRGVTSWNC